MNVSPLPPIPVGQSALPSLDCLPLSNGVAVQSRLLAAVAYDHNRTILQLEFRGGSVYQYFQVPHQAYRDLLQADSKGGYFNRRIRNSFRCARLTAC